MSNNKVVKLNKGGRPSTVTQAVLAKLEEGFCRGLSDRECCVYAGISEDALYRYCTAHEDFRERKELLKQQPKIKAKLIVADALDEGDQKTALWYLERKGKDEFSTRQETEFVSPSIVSLEEKQAALTEYMNTFLGVSAAGE